MSGSQSVALLFDHPWVLSASVWLAAWEQTSLNVLVDSGFVVWSLQTLRYVLIHRSFPPLRPPTNQLLCFAVFLSLVTSRRMLRPREANTSRTNISPNQRETIEINIYMVNMSCWSEYQMFTASDWSDSDQADRSLSEFTDDSDYSCNRR